MGIATEGRHAASCIGNWKNDGLTCSNVEGVLSSLNEARIQRQLAVESKFSLPCGELIVGLLSLVVLHGGHWPFSFKLLRTTRPIFSPT